MRSRRCRCSSRTPCCTSSSRRSTRSSTATAGLAGSCWSCLIVRGRLTAPLLYLSAGLERERDRYYEALRATRADGDALPWIELFLETVRSQSIDAVTRAERIIDLRERYRTTAAGLGSVNAMQVVELVCENPFATTRLVEARLGVARPTALRLLRQLEAAGILEEAHQGARGQRRYVARDLLEVVASDDLGAT